jgi:hypothetical protein
MVEDDPLAGQDAQDVEDVLDGYWMEVKEAGEA